MGGAELGIIMALGGAVTAIAGVLSRIWTKEIRELKAENRTLKRAIAANSEAMEAYLKAIAEEGEKWDA